MSMVGPTGAPTAEAVKSGTASVPMVAGIIVVNQS